MQEIDIKVDVPTVPFQIGNQVERYAPSFVSGFIEKLYTGNRFKLVNRLGTFSAKGFVSMEKDSLSSDRDKMLEKLRHIAGGVCSFAYTTVAGRVEYHVYAACHAALGKYDVRDTGSIRCLVLDVQNHVAALRHNHINIEYQEYVEYIIKESPWKDMFFDRPIEDIMQSGVEMNIYQPHSRVVSAAIALRVGSEHSDKRLKVFSAVKKLGFSGNVSFLVSQLFSKDRGDMVPRYEGGWHHCINSGLQVAGLVKFFNEGFFTKDGNGAPTAEGLRPYTIQLSIAPVVTTYTIDKHIQEHPSLEERKGDFGAVLKQIKGHGDKALEKCALIFTSLGIQ